jgi:hypothetical protein
VNHLLFKHMKQRGLKSHTCLLFLVEIKLRSVLIWQLMVLRFSCVKEEGISGLFYVLSKLAKN